MTTMTTLFSRRKLLVGLIGGLAAAAAFASPRLGTRVARRAQRLAEATPLGNRLVALDRAGYERWLGLAGQRFDLDGGFSARLEGVVPFARSGSPAWAGRDRAFAAVFQLEGGHSLPGNMTYVLSHPAQSGIELFMLEDEEHRGRLLAIFN